ncbi:uncharacterized protein LOC134259857 [Saccostrea cucullata]|uniref:uncharacterized protein LOC134259857 n=1 Tax=Saccostrea cuccullata TaxID=36930 RepID=UPI002ED14052
MAAVHRRIRRYRRYRRALPAPRVFRDRMDPLALDDNELFERYRFRRASILFIHDEIRGNLERNTHRNMALSPILSILLCLRFLATGATHLLIGDSLNISRNAAGREIRAVTSLIIRVFLRFIAFPVGEVAYRVMEGFRRIAGFPQVLGCVDGTFIKITMPSENEVDWKVTKVLHNLM